MLQAIEQFLEEAKEFLGEDITPRDTAGLNKIMFEDELIMASIDKVVSQTYDEEDDLKQED